MALGSGGISDLSTIGLDAYANITVTAGTPSITKSSSNVTSITDRAVGRFTLNMNALASADYGICGNVRGASSLIFEDTVVTKTTTAVGYAVYTTAAYADISHFVFTAGA